MRKPHRYYTPVVVKVIDQDEFWYYSPEFNPAWLPVPSHSDPKVKAIFDLSQWFTNEDGYFNGGQS